MKFILMQTYTGLHPFQTIEIIKILDCRIYRITNKKLWCNNSTEYFYLYNTIILSNIKSEKNIGISNNQTLYCIRCNTERNSF